MCSSTYTLVQEIEETTQMDYSTQECYQLKLPFGSRENVHAVLDTWRGPLNQCQKLRTDNRLCTTPTKLLFICYPIYLAVQSKRSHSGGGRTGFRSRGRDVAAEEDAVQAFQEDGCAWWCRIGLRRNQRTWLSQNRALLNMMAATRRWCRERWKAAD